MRSRPPILAPEAFWKGLRSRILGRSILFLNEVGSTNDVALKLAAQGAPDGTVVTAESQTAGRGRRGRLWSSTPGQSLLFSVILRPRLPRQDLPKITLAAAVAVARACEDLGVQVGIKWPNDLLVKGKKVCGILTEMAPKKDKMTSVILGIGVNLHQSRRDFPRELRPIATSLLLASGRKAPKVVFLQKLLAELERAMDLLQKDPRKLLGEWRKRSVTLGDRIRVAQAHGMLEGMAVDIDEMGALLVRVGDGVERIFSGDVVSVKNKS